MLQTPVVAFTASHMNAKRTTVSFQKLSCLFLFSLQMYSGRSSSPTEPFHKKARTGFNRYKLAKAACSSLKTSSTWVSLSQPTRYHNLCFITTSTCYCVRPLNGLRYFWALSSEKIQDSCQPDMRPFLSLTLWTSHEHSWSSPSPKNSCMCWILHLFYCQSLWGCSISFLVIWTILQGGTLA